MSRSRATEHLEFEAPSETVIAAVADLTGTDPLSLEPLYAAVDPDALDALFPTTHVGEERGHVTFTYHGCEIVVAADGTVQVSNADRAVTKTWSREP